MYRNDLFIYGTPQGLPSLIREMQRQLASYQVFTDQRGIFITSGVQQSLGLLARIPFPNGRHRVLVEQPCYPLLMEYLRTYGMEAEGIRRSGDGIDLDELERMFKTREIKWFYTVPRFHNPLGGSYNRSQRKLSPVWRPSTTFTLSRTITWPIWSRMPKRTRSMRTTIPHMSSI